MDPSLLAMLTVCRALHDGAAMVLFGSSLFATMLMPAGLRGLAARQVDRIAAPAIAIVIGTGLLRLPLTSIGMGDGWWDGLQPSTMDGVVVGTAFGHAWSIHLAAVAVLAGLHAVRPLRTGLGTAVASGLVVATLALSGHAAAGTGAEGLWSEWVLALHLLAASAWIGGLVQVLALLPCLARPETRRDAALALRRFSLAGHGFVAVAIVAGLAAVLCIGGLPDAASHPSYVGALGVKLALVCGMACLAVVNRYRWVPRLREQPTRAARGLVRNTRISLLLGCGALAAAGLLGLLDPP